MAKFLIVEDVLALRQHVTRLLKEKLPVPVEVVEAENGVQGLTLAKSTEPDLIIMDISMPDMTGIDVAQQIWADKPHMKILFWSQYHREAYVRELGHIVPDEAIHGYTLKSEPDEKFVHAIISVLLHDNPYIDPVVRGVEARLERKDTSLTDLEYETLLDLAMGLTDKAMATRRHISARGVQNRLTMLTAKLMTHDDAALKQFAGIEVYSPRMRAVLEALKRGLIDIDALAKLDKQTDDWIFEEYGFDKETGL